MSSEYERPDRDADETPCRYTEYRERATVDGEVPATGRDAEGLERRVWDALYGIEDPEMPISIVDLGLIYGVSGGDTTDESGADVTVEMTLTYTGCPARDMLLGEVEEAVGAVAGVEDAKVVLVWSPPWSVEMVTEAGRESLREFGLSI